MDSCIITVAHSDGWAYLHRRPAELSFSIGSNTPPKSYNLGRMYRWLVQVRASLSIRRFTLHIFLCLIRCCSFCSSLKSAIAPACMPASNSHPIPLRSSIPPPSNRSFSDLTPYATNFSPISSRPNEQFLRAPRNPQSKQHPNKPNPKQGRLDVPYQPHPSSVPHPSLLLQHHQNAHTMKPIPTSPTQGT